MITRIKLISLTVILVGSPILTIAALVTFSSYSSYTPSLSDLWLYFSPLVLFFFTPVLAVYFLRTKSSNFTNIGKILNGGIYTSIIIYLLMILGNIYFELMWFYNLHPSMWQKIRWLAAGFGEYVKTDFFPQSFIPLVLIVLMYLSLRINKSIESD